MALTVGLASKAAGRAAMERAAAVGRLGGYEAGRRRFRDALRRDAANSARPQRMAPRTGPGLVNSAGYRTERPRAGPERRSASVLRTQAPSGDPNTSHRRRGLIRPANRPRQHWLPALGSPSMSSVNEPALGPMTVRATSVGRRLDVRGASPCQVRCMAGAGTSGAHSRAGPWQPW